MTLAGLRVLAACTFAGSMAVPALLGKPGTGFLDRIISIDGSVYKYQVFVPENWSPKKKWPIILFLHGAGERGSDGLLQTEIGMPSAIRRDRSRFPALVVMPQCPVSRWWAEPAIAAVALAALAATSREFRGDPKKTYLTGLSMGGYGTWALAANNPGKFAALVPICGGIAAPATVLGERPDLVQAGYPDAPASYREVATKLGKTPIWTFHGDADPIVPVEGSRKMVEALKVAGGNVLYTEYPGVDHDSWDKAYAEPELMPWMLSKSL